MGVRFPGRAEIDPMRPQAIGICDGCGFVYNLAQLQWQFEYAGTALINKHLRKCYICLDKPQDQLRAIRLPPDPEPVYDARPEASDIDP
jgi:hypothetical protein